MKWETVGCLIYRIIAKVHHVLLCCYLRYNIKGDSKSLLIYDNPKVVCPDNLTVGEHCSLNEGRLLHCVGNVVLGNNVTVSAGAKIFSTQYDVSHWTESEKHYHLRKSVFINDGCWICSGGVILPGVYINGKNVIVGANAVVTRDINESNVLVAGVPAKIVKKYE